MKSIALSLTLSLSLVSGAWALETDRQQPIEVRADSFQGDEVQQTATYRGHVVVTQGSMQLTGDKLTVSVTPKGYRLVVLTGAPARFKMQRDTEPGTPQEWIHAQGQQITYDEDKARIELKGQAALDRSQNGVKLDSTNGELIAYDLRLARSEIRGGVVDGKPQRVMTIIAPRKRSDDKQPNDKPATTAP